MAFTLIGAHTEIESHCFFGAKSTIGGGCKIGKQSFIGINSTVFDDTIIGEKCIVGACTAVKRNMPDYSLCKTSSTNTEIKQYSEDIIESKLLFSKMSDKILNHKIVMKQSILGYTTKILLKEKK